MVSFLAPCHPHRLALLLTGLLVLTAGCDTTEPEPDDVPPTTLRCDGGSVTVLAGFDAALMPEAYQADVVAPGDSQVEVVREAFAIAPELLCRAVDYVAYVARPSEEGGALLGWTRPAQGNVIFISALAPGNATEENLDPDENPGGVDVARPYQIGVVGAILHEAAHAAHHLIDAQTETDEVSVDAGAWDDGAQAFAARIVEEHRLLGGFMEDEWVRMHDAFVREGMAHAYYGNGGIGTVSVYDLPENGFMTAYGGTKPGDDLAEMVAEVLLMHYVGAIGERELVNEPGDHACQELQSYGDSGLPAHYAAVFTKLSFLHDLGFLSDEAFGWCTGPIGARFDGATSLGQGFHIYDPDADTVGASLTTAARAVMGEREGTGGLLYFQMKAEGRLNITNDDGTRQHDADATLMLDLESRTSRIDHVSWPRGIYRLSMPPDLNILDPLASALGGSWFMVDFPDARASSTVSTDGYALVVRASNDRIEGVLRILDTLRPLAPSPLPLPEPFFHTRIHFVMAK